MGSTGRFDETFDDLEGIYISDPVARTGKRTNGSTKVVSTRRLHVPKSMHHMYAQCALRILSKFPLEGVDFHCKFINLNASDDKLLKLAQHQHTNGSLILKALHGLTP